MCHIFICIKTAPELRGWPLPSTCTSITWFYIAVGARVQVQDSVSRTSLQIDMQNYVKTKSDLLVTRKKKKKKKKKKIFTKI